MLQQRRGRQGDGVHNMCCKYNCKCHPVLGIHTCVWHTSCANSDIHHTCDEACLEHCDPSTISLSLSVCLSLCLSVSLSLSPSVSLCVALSMSLSLVPPTHELSQQPAFALHPTQQHDCYTPCHLCKSLTWQVSESAPAPRLPAPCVTAPQPPSGSACTGGWPGPPG